MPPLADSPLKKITLNLFAADVAEMERVYGHGWSEKVRQLVHDHLARKPTIEAFLKKLGYDTDETRT